MMFNPLTNDLQNDTKNSKSDVKCLLYNFSKVEQHILTPSRLGLELFYLLLYVRVFVLTILIQPNLMQNIF